MAENYSAQNSITIKRLRSNDSLMLTFEKQGWHSILPVHSLGQQRKHRLSGWQELSGNGY